MDARAWFASLPVEGAVDDYIVDYVTGVLEDAPDADTLAELVGGLCEPFGALPAAEQRRLAEQLLAPAVEPEPEPEPALPPPPAAAEPEPEPEAQPEQPEVVPPGRARPARRRKKRGGNAPTAAATPEPPAAPAAQQAEPPAGVRAWFASLPVEGAVVDDAIVDYVTGLLDDPPDADTVAELVGGLCEPFGALPAAEQRRLVGDLLSPAVENRAPAPAPAPAPARRKPAQRQQQQPPAPPDINFPEVRRAAVAADAAAARAAADAEAAERAAEEAAASDERIQFLAGLCPEAPVLTLRHVLHTVSAGDVNLAAARLLETDVPALTRRLERARRKAAQERVDSERREQEEWERARQTIVKRFGDEIVHEEPKTYRPTVEWKGGRKSKEKKREMRFRDGRVVSNTGARFIFESVREEWDGGSRGRVSSKGKRGVGWH